MIIKFYSCITARYDKQIYVPPRFPWLTESILFTNDRTIKNSSLTLRSLENPTEIVRPDLINRYHKLFPNRLLSSTDVSIYIDGNIEVISDPWPIIENFIQSNAILGIFKHPQRSNISEEVQACLSLNKFKYDDSMRANSQLAEYQNAKFPINFPLFSAGIIMRRHSKIDMLDNAMSLWWNQILKHTARDQVSLPYVLWKTSIPFVSFDVDIFNNKYFFRHPHNAQRSLAEKVASIYVSSKKLVKSKIYFK